MSPAPTTSPRRALFRALLFAALAAAGVACGTRGTLYTSALKPLALVATSGAVVQVVPQTRRAVIVTPGPGAPRPVRISAGARYAKRVPGTDAVAILTGSAKAPALDVLDVASGEVTTAEVPGLFDAIHFSPDGRFGVLVYLPSGGSGTLVARNLNEVGLWATAGREVTRLQLDTESLAPRGVLFGPVEPNRLLVAVTLERGVAVFDALHPEVAPRRISIRPQGSTVESAVVKAVFSQDAHWLFLRATGLDDVIAIELGPEVGRSVSASINFVAGGRGLSDIAAPPAGLADSVLAVYAASKEAWLLDARGIQDNAKRLQLTDAATRLAVLSGNRVLLWGEGSRSVAAWDAVDGRSGSALLDGAFASPVVVPALDKALFAHAAVSSAAGTGPALSTVTVSEETNRLRLKLQSIQLSKPMTASVLDGETQRFFFTVAQSPAVVTMDLRTLQLVEVSLDSVAQGLHHLTQGDWLVAEHAGFGYGDVTAVPAGTTDRSGAMHYADFAFTDDLDRPGDPP